MSVCIVAVVYCERSWQHTKEDIDQCGLPVVYVEREPRGVGSLAEVVNRGFRDACAYHKFDYVWFVTNIRFGPTGATQLAAAIDAGYDAAHPAFESDHTFCRQGEGIVPVPFIEFTAPMIRREVFEQIPLDQSMPYWGHDLDWGYRARQAGFKIGVDRSCHIRHTYIRHIQRQEPWTRKRAARRKVTDQATRNALVKKYGADWNQRLAYDGN